jgi:hypothetical protein
LTCEKIFGWDISTAIIGFAVLDSEGTFLSSSYCDLRDIDGLNAKADRAYDFVRFETIHKTHHDLGTHFVEDKLSGMGGGSNAGTIMKLGAFNAMVSWMIHQQISTEEAHCRGDSLVHVHPSTVKALMKKEGLVIPKGGNKKELTLDFVRARCPAFPYVTNRNDNPQPYCFDQADAFITAYAGFAKYLKGAKK